MGEVTTYEITKKFEFDAGHRVLGHSSKCKHCHGHRFVAYVSVQPKTDLNNLGMVIDFGILKEKIGDFIDTYWDHNFILSPEDKELATAIAPYCKSGTPFILHDNPTSENLAEFLFYMSIDLLKDHPVRVTKIVLYETPTSSSVFSEEGYKICNVCREWRSVFQFRPYYKTCQKCQGRAYRKTESGRQASNAASRKYKYGLSEERLAELHKIQKGCCAICSSQASLQIDHDHEKKTPRELLCRPCNLLLGHAKESPKTLQAAVEYLKAHKTQEEVTREPDLAH